MEAVTWLLLLLSLFVAAWFVVRGSGIPTRAGYEVALGSLEVPAGAPPAPPGGSPRGDRDGPANDAGALRAESTGAMERLGAACGCDEARSAREGPLEKLSSKGRWQQRYFVLSETHLAYLGGRGDRRKAPRRVKFALALSDVTAVDGRAELASSSRLQCERSGPDASAVLPKLHESTPAEATSMRPSERVLKSPVRRPRRSTRAPTRRSRSPTAPRG